MFTTIEFSISIVIILNPLILGSEFSWSTFPSRIIVSPNGDILEICDSWCSCPVNIKSETFSKRWSNSLLLFGSNQWVGWWIIEKLKRASLSYSSPWSSVIGIYLVPAFSCNVESQAVFIKLIFIFWSSFIEKFTTLKIGKSDINSLDSQNSINLEK